MAVAADRATHTPDPHEGRLQAAGGPRSRRYFAASVLHGRLYLQGMLDRDGWDLARLVYVNEETVGAMCTPQIGDRTVETETDLEAVLRESAESPTLFAKVWLREGLEDIARRHWEAAHAQRR
jgi:hypothetical protein